jgi:GntR family transcriptional regulator / MocR family aminotransferase
MWIRAMNIPLFYLDPNSTLSLQHQIRKLLIDAILDGTLPVGVRLPSSRQLAKQLNVARNTVISAYQQLIDEGYLMSRERSGCYINPDMLKGRVGLGSQPQREDDNEPFWDRRVAAKQSINHSRCYPNNWMQYPYPFIDGQFDRDLFPIAEWRECVKITQSVQEIHEWAADSGKQDDPLLIEQIRTKLLPRRGISAQPDQILVTLGSQQALSIIAQLLITQQTCVGVEKPGYADAAHLFSLYTDAISYLTIDDEGLAVSEQLNDCDYVYTTPSHQFPTTVTLSMSRRKALLERAWDQDFVIIEDDFACEANYLGEPKPALKSLDKNARVIYVSSFSKLLAPGLRLGYMVAPKAFINKARSLRRLLHQHAPSNNQRATALFLSLGHYDVLSRKLNQVHEQRWHELRCAVNACFPQPDFMINKSVGGTACWIRGPEALDARSLVEIASKRGILLEYADAYLGDEHSNNCFRLSVTSISADKIKEGVEQLAQLIRQMLGDARETLNTAVGKRLGEQELQTIIPGASLLGVTAYGDPYTVKLLADGQMEGVAGEEQQDCDRGRWWFEDGLWWRQWQSWTYGESQGFNVVLDNNTIKWFDQHGDLVDTDLLIKA